MSAGIHWRCSRVHGTTESSSVTSHRPPRCVEGISPVGFLAGHTSIASQPDLHSDSARRRPTFGVRIRSWLGVQSRLSAGRETCVAMRAPAHGFLAGERDEWACDRGFMKRGDSCVPVAVPANGCLDRSGNDWRCERGFKQDGASCVRLVVPAGAYFDYSGNGWTCAEGLREHDGACIEDR